MKVLELFCGSKSFTKEAEKRGHKCITLDNQNKFNPTFCKDIMGFDVGNIVEGYYDIIWASPPCIQYSHAKRSGVRDIEGSNRIVLMTIELIKKFKPKYWFIENPQTGLLKNQPFMEGLPFQDVSYCKYGFPYRKQTRVWTNCKEWKARPVCKKDCNFIKDGKHIMSVGNDRKKYTLKTMDKKQKYKIPSELCLEIIKACEV